MTAMEYGRQNPETIMLLHGGGLSWWNYRQAAQELAEQYHVVLPVLDGHADSNAPFTTIEENAARLISYIDDRFDGQLLALGGLSLGGQIAAEMLSQRKDICRYALLESTLTKPAKLTAALIDPTFGMSCGLIRRKWFAKLQSDYLGIPRELFDDYYRDTCKIGKADMVTFLKANSLYAIKPSLSETRAKVKIVAGSKEQKSIRDSAKLLHNAIPGSSMEILPGLRHGDLSLNGPEQYRKILTDWMELSGGHTRSGHKGGDPMTLKEMIFKRKSCRSFTGKPVDAEMIEKILSFDLKPLYPEIKVRMDIVGRDRVKCICPWTTPQLITVYSEETEGYLENIGFLFQQMDLYLQTLGLGVCWLGLGRMNPRTTTEVDGMKFVIMLAFGHPKGNRLRQGRKDFKRKAMEQITDRADARLEPARLAPSAVNSQPWFFTHEGDTVHVWCSKKGSRLDAGIALAHLYVSSEETFTFFQADRVSNLPGYTYIGSVNL